MTLNLNIQDQIQDVARSNLFEVNMSIMGSDFIWKCKAASLPKASVGKVDLAYMNRVIGLAGDRTYDAWTITVYNDYQQITREKFLKWQELCQTYDKVIHGELPNSYKNQTAQIWQYDRAGNKTASFTITGIWPMNIGEVALEWGISDAAEVFTVELNVDWFKSNR